MVFEVGTIRIILIVVQPKVEVEGCYLREEKEKMIRKKKKESICIYRGIIRPSLRSPSSCGKAKNRKMHSSWSCSDEGQEPDVEGGVGEQPAIKELKIRGYCS